MAVIVGMKPADISDFTPTELPIDEMAKGLIATQKRADEVKNTIALGDSALAIETRPFEMDIKTAEQIQNDYKADVNKLIVDAGGDFAKIDNSQIQGLATKYATDERVRMLTSAKKEFDVANSLARKIRETNGSELFFGTVDPRKEGLYDENGNWLNFSSWDMQSELNHVKAAQSLFENLGHDLQKTVGYDENQDGEWSQYVREQIMTTEKKNQPRIKQILDQSVLLYDGMSAGKQYRRVEYNNIKKLNPSLTDAEINSIIDEKVKNMVFSIGMSQEIYEKFTTPVQLNRNTYSSPNTKIKTDKGKDKDKDAKQIVANATTLSATFEGFNIDNMSLNEFIEQMNNENPIVQNLPELIKNVDNINNEVILKNALFAVNPAINPKLQGDRLHVTGAIQSLDNDLTGANFSGDNNRSIVRVFNTRDNKDNKEAKDKSVVDLDDFALAYSLTVQGQGKSIEEIKYNLLGTSTADPYISMFDVYHDDKLKTHSIVINPVVVELKNILEKKVKDNPNDQYSKIKLDKLNKKLADANVFKNDHKNELEKYSQNFDKIKRNKESFEKINEQAMASAGLDTDMIKQLINSHKIKGFTTPYLTETQNTYSDARLDALSEALFKHMNYVKYNTAIPDNTPKSVIQQLSGLTKVEINKTTGRPEYKVDSNALLKGKERINSDINLKRTYEFYNNFLSDVLQKDLNINELKNVIGVSEYNRLVNIGYATNARESSAIFTAYIDKKLNMLLPDSKYQKDKEIFKSAFLKLTVPNIKVSDPNKLSYYHGNPHDIEKEISNNTKTIIKDRATQKGYTIPDEVIKYYDNIDKSLKSYDANIVLYRHPDTEGPSAKSSTNRILNQAWTKYSDPNIKLTRLRYNTQPGKGEVKLEEEYNKEELKNNLVLKYRSENDGKLPSDADLKELFNKLYQGFVYDPQNEFTPFTAIYSVPQYDSKNNYTTSVDIQVPIQPSPATLLEHGILPLKGKYLNIARKQLKETGNSFIELTYENESNIKTKAYVAQFDFGDIRKGEYYMYQNVGDPLVSNPLLPVPPQGGEKRYAQKPVKIGTGTLDDVINLHASKIQQNLNMDQLQQVLMIEKTIAGKKPEIQNRILKENFFFTSDNLNENLAILQEMKNMVTKAAPIETEETPIEEEEEEEGK